MITSNSLDASLESADAARARIRIKGQIQGSKQGGPGKLSCDGLMTFDRRAAWIDQLDLNRVESRQAGPIEAGLDYKSTFTMTRQAAEAPAALSDAALAGVSLAITPASELLKLDMPGRTAALLHDRQWHKFWEDRRLIILKRLSGAQVIAQCNPHAGPSCRAGAPSGPHPVP